MKINKIEISTLVNQQHYYLREHKGSTEVTELLQGENGVNKWVEAKFVVDTDIDALGDKMIACIEAKREALGI